MTITIRGVPLSQIDKLSSKDTDTRAYGMAQSAFNAARWEGTPLLPAAQKAEITGPAPYLRAVLTAMLMRHIEGENPEPQGEDEIRAAAEAHLALIEVTARNISNMGQVRDPFPTLAEESRPIRFGVKLSDTPLWLHDALLKSLIRIEGSTTVNTSNLDQAASGDAVLQLSESSAYWRNIPAHGNIEGNQARSRASTLKVAAAATPIHIPAWTPPVTEKYNTTGEDWVYTAREQMLGALLAQRALPPKPDGDALKGLVQKQYEEYRKVDKSTPPGAVINASSIQYFLLNFDAMATYGFQLV